MKRNALSIGRLAARIGMTCAAATLLTHSVRAAADQVWSGGTSTDWSDLLNWNSGAGPVPATGDNAVFNSVFSNQPSITANTSNVGLWLATNVGQDVTISNGGFNLNLAGSTTVNLLTNTAILLDDTANHNLTIGSGGTTNVLASTSFRVNNAATLTVANSVAIATGTTLTLAGTNASGTTVITGSTTSTTGKITVSTSGTVKLSGTNLHSGGTQVTTGTLQAGSNDALGTGTLTLITNQTVAGKLSSDSSTARTFSNPISIGNSSAGSNTFELGDATNNGKLTFNGNVTLTTGTRTHQINSDVEYAGVVSGSFGITKTGAGTLTLSNSNTFTSTLTLSAGRLNIGNAHAIGSGAGTFSIGSGTIDNSTGSALTMTTNNPITIAGNFTFAGSDNLTFGSGNVGWGANRTITLNGSNKTLTFGGPFQATDAGASHTLTVNGAGNTIAFNGFKVAPSNNSKQQTVDGSGNVVINGPITNAGGASDSIRYNGSGTMAFNAASGSITGGSVGVVVANGTVLAGADNAFTNCNLTLGFATAGYTTAASTPTFLISGAYTVARPVTVANVVAASYTIGGSNTSGTAQYTGNITLGQPTTLTAANGGTVDFNTGTWTTNNKAITVTGAGTSVVQISNSLSTLGGVTISSGKLKIGATGSLTTPILGIGNGAALDVSALSGGYSLSGIALTVTTNGSTTGLLDASGIALTLGGDLVINFTSGSLAPGGIDLINFGSETGNFTTVTLTGGITATLSRSGDLWTGSGYQFDQTTGVLAAVPEPNSVAMAVAGLLGVVVVIRRRRMAR